MIKHKLAAQTSRETGYSLDEIEEIFSSAISITLRTLSTGEAIKISDFGRFSLSPTGRLSFHPYLYTKKVVKGQAAAPAKPEVLYKVRRSRVKEQFKAEQVAEAKPRDIRKISTVERLIDYSELVEE